MHWFLISENVVDLFVCTCVRMRVRVCVRACEQAGGQPCVSSREALSTFVETGSLLGLELTN